MFKSDFEELHEQWLKAKALGLPEAEKMKEDLYASHWFHDGNKVILKSKYGKSHENGFNIGHFPKGTIAEIKVFYFEEPYQVEVESVLMNAPGHWCIIHKPLNEDDKFPGISFSHVSRIIKRGTGDVVFYQDRDKSIARMPGDYAVDLAPKTAILSYDAINEQIYVQKLSGKRLNKFIKRNINRFLSNQRKARKAYDEMMMDDYFELDSHFHDFCDPYISQPKPVYTKEMLLEGRDIKGVLSFEEAKERLKTKKSLYVIGKGYQEEGVYFFTDDYCAFGSLPVDWVHSSHQIPNYVVPREGLEDGVVDTLEKYVFIFQRGEKFISSMDELLAYLNVPADEFDISDRHLETDRPDAEVFAEMMEAEAAKFSPENHV